jgi:predicted PurR-regulated permease PerM
MLVLLFFLFCFVWGITIVVNKIHKNIKSWLSQENKNKQKMEPKQEMVLKTQPSDHVSMEHILNHIKQAGDLHRNGILIDEEFERIKARPIKNAQSRGCESTGTM